MFRKFRIFWIRVDMFLIEQSIAIEKCNPSDVTGQKLSILKKELEYDQIILENLLKEGR